MISQWFYVFIYYVLVSVCAVVGSSNGFNTNNIFSYKNNCTSFYNCINTALARIKQSEHYHLMENVWFNKIDNGKPEEFRKEPKNFTDLIGVTSDLFNTHTLFWHIARGLNVKVFQLYGGDDFALSLVKDDPHSNSRTFGLGVKRRLQMALLPIMYKLGVITTLLVALTVMTLKGLTVGIILLTLTFGGIFAKFKTHYAHPHWESESHHHSLQKEVHIHVHPFAGKPHIYSTWHRKDEIPTTAKDNSDFSEYHTLPTWSYLPPKQLYSQSPSLTDILT